VVEPVVGIAIAKLAFDELVKAGAGEVGKKAVGEAVGLAKSLAGKIRQRFQGNERAMSAIAELEQSGSEASLNRVAKYLDLEMDEDPVFEAEIRQMAQQIINFQNQHDNRKMIQNAGRDIINIETVGDNARIGGA
jgi:hypothetical protein